MCHIHIYVCVCIQILLYELLKVCSRAQVNNLIRNWKTFFTWQKRNKNISTVYCEGGFIIENGEQEKLRPMCCMTILSHKYSASRNLSFEGACPLVVGCSIIINTKLLTCTIPKFKEKLWTKCHRHKHI